jgi:hypothetical protein
MTERAANENMRETVSCGSQWVVVWYSILKARKVRLLSQCGAFPVQIFFLVPVKTVQYVIVSRV